MSLILNFFKSKGADVLITTRELLKFGLRAWIDSCIYQLVKSQLIVRVARGVFHLAGRAKPVSVEEVAEIKAKSFGRNIMKDANRIAEELNLCRTARSENGLHSFQIDGRTSSFMFGTIKIKLRGTSKKNFALGDSPEGQVLRALQATGKSYVNEELFEQAVQKLPKYAHPSLLNSSKFISAWLNDLLLRWFYSAQPAHNSHQSISSVVISEESVNQDADGLVSEDRQEKSSWYAVESSRSYVLRHHVAYSPAIAARRNE
jgi:hypothetical protein